MLQLCYIFVQLVWCGGTTTTIHYSYTSTLQLWDKGAVYIIENNKQGNIEEVEGKDTTTLVLTASHWLSCWEIKSKHPPPSTLLQGKLAEKFTQKVKKQENCMKRSLSSHKTQCPLLFQLLLHATRVVSSKKRHENNRWHLIFPSEFFIHKLSQKSIFNAKAIRYK